MAHGWFPAFVQRSFASQLLTMCPPSTRHSSRHVAPGIHGAQVPASGILAVTAEENTEAEKAGSIGGGGRGCCLK